MDAVFYLKDTGFQTPDLSGEQDTWLVNQGEPIRLHITNFQIISVSNPVITSQKGDFYYVPTVASRELTQITFKCYALADFTVSGFIYIYDKNSSSFQSIENPPTSALTSLLEQAIDKNSHFDLYMSDGSGITPDYFKKLPLYWLAKTKSYNSDIITTETHLNVKLINYNVSSASTKKFDFSIQVVVFP